MLGVNAGGDYTKSHQRWIPKLYPYTSSIVPWSCPSSPAYQNLGKYRSGIGTGTEITDHSKGTACVSVGINAIYFGQEDISLIRTFEWSIKKVGNLKNGGSVVYAGDTAGTDANLYPDNAGQSAYVYFANTIYPFQGHGHSVNPIHENKVNFLHVAGHVSTLGYAEMNSFFPLSTSKAFYQFFTTDQQ